MKTRVVYGFWLLLAGGPALAHHPMGGQTPATLWHGLLSGLGHPVIGVDHLAFILGLGLIAALTGLRGRLAPVLFVPATVGGALLHFGGVDLPLAEPLVAVSVLALGLMLVRRAGRSATALAAAAGILHGFAYGEAIVGAETQPLVAYLLGFALVQGVLCCLAYAAGRAFLTRRPGQESTLARRAGAATSLVGAGALTLLLLG